MVKSKGTDIPGIPLNRIRTIMKSTADTGLIQHESLYVMSKATELFIQYLASNAYKSIGAGTMKYGHLSKLVSENESLEFLRQIIPQKITVKEYKEIVENKKNEDTESSESEEEKSPKK